MVWNDCKKELPETGIEVLVLVDGHRGPAWRNNYALVAYLSMWGDWWEERHSSEESLQGVIKWAHIPYPE